MDAPFGTAAWTEFQPVIVAQLVEWGYDPHAISAEGFSEDHYWGWTGEWGDHGRAYEPRAWDDPQHGEWVLGQVRACWEKERSTAA